MFFANKAEVLESDKYHFMHPLRVTLACLLVFIQTMIIYSVMGGWFDVSPTSFEGFPHMAMVTVVLMMRTTIIAILATIIGSSAFKLYERYGPIVFMKHTVVRIGGLILLFLLVIQPGIYLVVNQFDVESLLSRSMLEFCWQQLNSGPFFFFVVILIFNICYCIYKKWFERRMQVIIELRQQSAQLRSALFVLGMGVASFVIRIFAPIYDFYGFMHIGLIALMVGMYCSGLIAAKNSWVTKVSISFSIPWVSFAIICLPILVMAIYYSGSWSEVSGRLTTQSLFMSLWEPMASMGGCFFIETLFFRYLNKKNKTAAKLSELVLSVIAIHPLPVITFILLLKPFDIPVMLKWLIVSIVSVIVSFLLAAVVHRIAPRKKKLRY